MNALLVMLVVLVALSGGYLVYGRLVARTLGVDASRTTPAHAQRDGVDFVPARHWLVLFGHHFSSICGAGPIVGPAVAVAYWGWAPSIVWILVGSVFLGAVSDFSALVVSVRHRGRSIADVAGEVVSRRARLLFSVFLLLALILVLAVFAILAAKTFAGEPRIVLPSLAIIPGAVLTGFLMNRGRGASGVVAGTLVGLGLLVVAAWAGARVPVDLASLIGASPDAFLTPERIWVLFFMAYCVLASVTPVQYLLQPRDYLASYVLFAAIAVGVVGVVVTRPDMQADAFHSLLPSDWPQAGPIWPLMFVTIACGAISGFHSLVSSGTTCKQLGSEAHACRIGYGGMLTEALVGGLVVICVGAGLSATEHAAFLRPPGAGPVAAFAEGYGRITTSILGGYGAIFAAMALNAFILTTLDSATRIGRYLAAELFGIRDRWTPTLLVVAASAALALSGQWMKIWPAFGASNQLVGALALLVVSCWLLQSGRLARVTLWPALFILITTIGAFGYLILQALGMVGPERDGRDWFLAAVGALLVALAVFVSREALGLLKRRAFTGGR